MINLLPPKEKEALGLEIKKNLLITLAGEVLVFLICLILVLFSLKFYVLGEADSKGIFLEQYKKTYQTEDSLAVKRTIQNYNAELQQTSSFLSKESYFGDAIKTIAGIQKPRGLRFTGLALSRADGGGISVSVSGQAASREDLLAFKGSIENEKKIASIYFSPESWIKAVNADFSLNFKFLKNESH
jgi:hypothetical protein